MNDEQKTDLAIGKTLDIAPSMIRAPDQAAESTLVPDLSNGANRAASPEHGEEAHARAAWLNIVSGDTLRRLWDTPEEDEAWRDLLKEI